MPKNNIQSEDIHKELYDCVSRIYPIGLAFKSDVYQDHKKYIAYLKLIDQQPNSFIEDRNIFIQGFHENIQEYEVNEFNFPANLPSWGVKILIWHEEHKNIKLYQYIYALKSTISSYYTIYTQDIIQLFSEGQRYKVIKVLNNNNSNQHVYELVKSIFLQNFPNSKYVNIEDLKYVIRGLQLPFSHNLKEHNVFHALFGRQLFRQELV